MPAWQGRGWTTGWWSRNTTALDSSSGTVTTRITVCWLRGWVRRRCARGSRNLWPSCFAREKGIVKSALCARAYAKQYWHSCASQTFTLSLLVTSRPTTFLLINFSKRCYCWWVSRLKRLTNLIFFTFCLPVYMWCSLELNLLRSWHCELALLTIAAGHYCSVLAQIWLYLR